MKAFLRQHDQTITVISLDEPDTQIAGRITNVSRHGFGLMLDDPVASGSAVRVDFEGNLLLGEVSYCQQRRDGAGYAVGLRAEHVLTGTQELKDLVDAVMGSSQLRQSSDEPAKQAPFQRNGSARII